ncbi:hypothetical protein JCM19231_1811 [Vibrio ishigakensis]|uniref:Uncharacterized protein n=1 Tax=Vibrio ishigakensis TaxID=1481914 RepID=A0A0B8NX05_9VIBR|nr:hypothetical protein JCM19231_1811 [Vibrio ishigakensis]
MKSFLITVAVAYVLIAIAFYSAQRKFLYFPQSSSTLFGEKNFAINIDQETFSGWVLNEGNLKHWSITVATSKISKPIFLSFETRLPTTLSISFPIAGMVVTLALPQKRRYTVMPSVLLRPSGLNMIPSL